MTEAPKIPAVLDAIADKVLKFRPTDKGLSALKKRKLIERETKKARE